MMNYYFEELAGKLRRETVNMLVLGGTLYLTLVLTVTMQIQLNKFNDIESKGIL